MNFLTELEKKHIIQNSNRVLKQIKLPIRYEQSNFQSSFDSSKDANYSDWKEYWCTIEKITRLKTKKYKFAEVQEGDIIIYFPSDTDLNLEAQKYEIQFMNDIYKSEFKPQPYDILVDRVISYMLVGELND
jgi:hypothetical protein